MGRLSHPNLHHPRARVETRKNRKLQKEIESLNVSQILFLPCLLGDGGLALPCLIVFAVLHFDLNLATDFTRRILPMGSHELCFLPKPFHLMR